ncbi:MAG: DUF559 domain-containing protein [Bacillota bacterium]|nr:DUF559 domain-containing protein [Bacillota bacterium]
MKHYRSHFSALAYWPVPLAHEFFREQIREAGDKQQLILDRGGRTRRGDHQHILCSTPIPDGGLLHRRDMGIVSPEMLFVQLANELDDIELIILGDLLCSRPDRYRTPALTRHRRLFDFATAAYGLRGRRRALEALRYVKEDASSIMEVFLDLLIGLPNYLGGLGITGGVLNAPVPLTAESSVALRQHICYIDYAFPEQRIGYEYQGQYHDRNTDHDSSRAMALQRMGYTIVTVTRSQLYDDRRRAQLLEHCLKLHGKRWQLRTEKYPAAHRNIIAKLPRRSAPHVADNISQAANRSDG